MSDICKVCNGTGIVIRVDNYGVPDPVPSRCPACVTSTTASNTSAPTSDPEAAAEVESALRLLRELEIESCDQRTGHSQKWAVIEAKLARLRAEVQALREENNDLRIGQTEVLSYLKSLHEWFLAKAPEHYKGCGLWIDVDITLKAYADEAAMERSAE